MHRPGRRELEEARRKRFALAAGEEVAEGVEKGRVGLRRAEMLGRTTEREQGPRSGRRARRRKACARVDLPAPGSPAMVTSCPLPAAAASRSSTSSASSSPRPIGSGGAPLERSRIARRRRAAPERLATAASGLFEAVEPPKGTPPPDGGSGTAVVTSGTGKPSVFSSHARSSPARNSRALGGRASGFLASARSTARESARPRRGATVCGGRGSSVRWARRTSCAEPRRNGTSPVSRV